MDELDEWIMRNYVKRETLSQPPASPAALAEVPNMGAALLRVPTLGTHMDDPNWHYVEQNCPMQPSQDTESWEIINRCCIKP